MRMWQKLLQLQESLQFVVSTWVQIFCLLCLFTHSLLNLFLCSSAGLVFAAVSGLPGLWCGFETKRLISPHVILSSYNIYWEARLFSCPCCFPCACFFTSVQQTKVLQEQEDGSLHFLFQLLQSDTDLWPPAMARHGCELSSPFQRQCFRHTFLKCWVSFFISQ